MAEKYYSLNGTEFDTREEAIEHDFRERYQKLVAHVTEAVGKFADAPLETKERFAYSVKGLDVWAVRVLGGEVG